MTDKKIAAGVNQTANQIKYSNNTSKSLKKSRYCIKVSLPDEDDRAFTGQVARTLLHLTTAGEKGITALEVSSWAFRLASYVFILRHKHGLKIETQHEEHNGGWHARYVLQSSVSVKEQGVCNV